MNLTSKRCIIIVGLLTAQLVTLGGNLELVLDLRGQWKFTIGDDMQYADPDYNDENWERIFVPSMWEDEGFNGYDGYAWYRKHFNGAEIANLDNVVLELGYIDDVDHVYVNGHFVGYSGSFPPRFHTAWTAKRRYHIPLEYLNLSGDNVIAVRVYDTTQGGGIIQGKIGLYTDPESEGFMSMEGLWKFQEGNDEEWSNADFDDEHWPYIMVPASWKNYDWRKHETYGWYRREFQVSEEMLDQPLNAVLGKIDDFDQVYINGQLIGETNDGRRFGQSDSYRQFRNYPIPEGILKLGKNVIAVKVLDLGGDAGIYSGPVGIAKRDQARRILWKY